MKTQEVLAAGFKAIVLLVAALCVPNGFSQGRRVMVTPPQRSVSGPAVLRPSSNPVGRMTNPVAPIIQSPFMPNPATTPAASSARGAVLNGVNFRRNNVVVPVYVPQPYYYYDPYYYPQITIPGLLPGARHEDYRDTRYEDYRSTSLDPDPNAYSGPETASTFLYEPEPRMIIREPQPNRVVQQPTVGTSRTDVIKQLGEPWGRIIVRGIETLYFDGVTVVIGADGRVTSAR